MPNREAVVFSKLKDRITRPGDRFQRIENGLEAGWPDCNYCMSGVEGWIEIKAPREVVHAVTPLFGSQHGIETEQVNWFMGQLRARGRCFLFIGTERRLMLIAGAKVVAACTARGRGITHINDMTTKQLVALSAWHEESPVKNPMRWADMREILTS